jgi:DNA-binding NarL/FixJ family response regulator
MDSRKLRILLADDHALVRDGLKRLIDEQADMEVVAEAGDGPDAVRQCQQCHPDVALIDVSMPVWDGVKTAEMLRSACPDVRIVCVTRHNDKSFVRRMFEAGAVGYVLKQSRSTDLTEAIRSVARGDCFIDPAIRVASVGPARERPTDETLDTRSSATLSADEERVLRLVALSQSGREIGARLALDIETVLALQRDGMAKLGLQSRMQVIDFGRKSGWLK